VQGKRIFAMHVAVGATALVFIVTALFMVTTAQAMPF
jgi:hypothetical protein